MIRLKTITSVVLAAFLLSAPSLLGQVNDSTLTRGLVWEDPNQNFKLKLGLRLQPYFSFDDSDYDFRELPDIEAALFRLRRARLKFDGYLGSPNWVYKVELDLVGNSIGGLRDHPNFGGRTILDAVVKYQILNGRYSLWVGQTKLPGNRQRLVSSSKLQFVDRSLVNSRFTLDRDIGIQFHGNERFRTMPLRWALSVAMGEGRNVVHSESVGLQYTARIDFLPLGSFLNKGELIEADVYREPKPKIAIGIVYDYNDRAHRSRVNTGEWMMNDSGFVAVRDVQTLFVDVVAKYKGWSMYTEYIDRRIENPIVYNPSGALLGSYFAGRGFNAQLGYVFPSNWEFAGRFTYVDPHESILSTDDVLQYTLAISRYIRGHNIKIQSDISYSEYMADHLLDHVQFRLQLEVGI